MHVPAFMLPAECSGPDTGVHTVGHQRVVWSRPLSPFGRKREDGLIETKVDPLLKSLHNDPRNAALLKRLNLPN
jgi:hypothetical protein